MWKRPLIRVYRATLAAGFACASIWLSHRFGPIPACLIAAVFAAGLCAGFAALLRRQQAGRVSFVNYAAGVVLPLGYRISRGKLPVIVFCSWLGWTAVSVAAVIYTLMGKFTPAGRAPPSTATLVLLWLSWIAAGLALLSLSTTMITRAHTRRPLLKPAAVLTLMLVGSAVLFWTGHPALALLVVGGPIALMLTAYGLFIAFVLIAKPRWN